MSKGSARRKQQVSDEQLTSSWETIFGSKNGRTISNQETDGRLLPLDGGKQEFEGGGISHEDAFESTSNTADCRDTGSSVVYRD